MSDDRERLEQAVSELERITQQLAASEDSAITQSLADEALRQSAIITEVMPRVVREIEDAAMGRPGTSGEATSAEDALDSDG